MGALCFTPTASPLHKLHKLPHSFWVKFKVVDVTNKVLYGSGPGYLHISWYVLLDPAKRLVRLLKLSHLVENS